MRRIEVRETAQGYHTAVAFGAAGKPATFRQKRDGVDEYIEGEADRLEYDSRADTVRFVGNASVKRLRGANVADEMLGNVVSFDSVSEVFSVTGGTPTPGNPTGRVRDVLAPSVGSIAAAEAADAANAASKPTRSPSSGAQR